MIKIKNLFTVALVFILIFLFSTVSRVSAAWSADIQATTGPSPAWYPSLSCDYMNRWNIAFQDIRSGPVFYNTSFRKDIFYKRYDGASWTLDVQVSAVDYYNGYTPAIVCSNNYIYATWADESSRGLGAYSTQIDIFFSGSSDGGQTWSVPVNLSQMGLRDDYPEACNSPRIAVAPNGNICVVWEHPTQAYQSLRDVVAAISSDRGQTWTTTKLTSATTPTNGQYPLNEYPSVVADNTGKFFVVWCEDFSTGWAQNGTTLRFSSYNGAWAPQTTLVAYNSSPPNAFRDSVPLWKPDIAVKDANNLYVVFCGDLTGPARQRHVYYMCRTNGSANWTTPVMVSTANQESDVPRIIYDPAIGGVRVVYEDNKHWAGLQKQKYSDIIMATSADNGKTWAYTTLATGNYAGDPWIAENKSGGLAVTWEDNRTGDWRIYLKTGP